jgi:hypothetical protein
VVAAVEGKNVQITISAEKPDWVKKGAPVIVKDDAGKSLGPGKVVEVSATTLTIASPRAGDMKTGQTVTLEKGKGALSGC